MKKLVIKFTATLSVIAGIISCATSPTGRKQLRLLPESQMEAMGKEAFQQMKSENRPVQDPELVNYVKCVVNPLIQVLPKVDRQQAWEVQVFQDDTANAFALPGGKIGVNTGMLKVAKTNGQLAAVIGHEIGHVIAEHGNERVSQQLGANLALATAGVLSKGSPHRDVLMGALGLGAQVGVLLPFSRTQENEADIIGQEMMAKAGYDPRQSVELWKNMLKSAGGAPPEFLSTHPSSQTRIEHLQDSLPDTLKEYEQARKAGKHPNCVRPVK